MGDMSVQAASQQTGWMRDPSAGGQAAGGQEADILHESLARQEEEQESLTEMIRTAQEKAKAQREALKLPKNSARYGDAPLEAYARLARARNQAQVNAASGYARRKIIQLKSALRTDGDNSTRIKAAIRQLQKAVSRGEKKKKELNRERLAELRKARSEEQRQREELELRRRRTQRMIREAGYLREAEVSDRLATHLTATQMELRQQAQELSASAAASVETAVQQYTAAGSTGVESVSSGPSLEGWG